MFDFILQIKNDNQFLNIKDNDLLSGKKFSRFDFDYTFCYLTVYSFCVLNEFHFENGSEAIFVYGKVYRQMSFDNNRKHTVTPEEISSDLHSGEDLLNIYKGNYTIIIIQKESKSICVHNDHFGLKPIYYREFQKGVYISSNLNFCRLFSYTINYTAVLERLLFSYPISSDTYITGTKFLNGGEVLWYRKKIIEIESRFNLMQFVFRASEPFNINRAVEIFNYSVSQRANHEKKITASLTGGFDSRALVSVLLNEGKRFDTYSFGCEGGENTEIPMQISLSIPQLNYTAFYLDKYFEDRYVHYATEAIKLSDGLSSFERANYPYVFNKISENSRTVLSGILGGELIGPVNMLADYINGFYYSLFYKDRDLSWKEQLTKKPYVISEELIKMCSDELSSKIEKRKAILNSLRKEQNGFLFYYHDLLDLGYRRFYGAEVQIERYYAENLTPFLDFDLLNYVLSTDYVNLFRGSYNKNHFSRRYSKVIQASAICRNFPLLGKIPVDRNFKPEDLFSSSRRLLIPFKFYARKIKKAKSKPEFSQSEWDKIFYSSISKCQSEIFTCFKNIPGGELNIATSLNIWLKEY